MSATDELRRLLDERGVEWSSPSDLNSSFADSITFIGDVAVVSEIEGSDLLRINFDGTPEQAIAATLGNDGVGRSNDGVAERGTCRMKQADWDDGTCTWGCICSACGKKFEHETGKYWHYCPECGREVVE